jgi:thiol-disulfide isomerase/thioredoxin
MTKPKHAPRSVPTDFQASRLRATVALSLVLAVLAALRPADPLAAQQGQLKILHPGPDLGLAPDFSWTTTEGETLTPESLAGKVVLLDFWASWCMPCRRAVPHLKSLHQSIPDDVFRIVGINVDDEIKKLQGWVATYGLPWAQVWDQSREIVQSLDVTNFPTYVLLDHQGRVIYTTTGFSPTTGRVVDYRVRTAVQAAQASR